MTNSGENNSVKKLFLKRDLKKQKQSLPGSVSVFFSFDPGIIKSLMLEDLRLR